MNRCLNSADLEKQVKIKLELSFQIALIVGNNQLTSNVTINMWNKLTLLDYLVFYKNKLELEERRFGNTM